MNDPPQTPGALKETRARHELEGVDIFEADIWVEMLEREMRSLNQGVNIWYPLLLTNQNFSFFISHSLKGIIGWDK